MKKALFIATFLLAGVCLWPGSIFAQRATPTPVATASATPFASAVAEPTPSLEPRVDITQRSEQIVEPLVKLLESQDLGQLSPTNAFKYAIRNAISAGVPPNTVVLLLLLPLVAAIIAASRHLIGIRGFGIFLPAALSVVFLAIGPVVGIGLFLIIVAMSTFVRLGLKVIRLRLQYLPRMAFMLWFVSIAVLFALFTAPILNISGLTSVSIFPVLVLTLLAEDFTKVQLGKSAKTAINLTTETLVLALISYVFLTLKPLQEFALLNPEILLLGVAIFDLLVGRYLGLRIMEYWKFRKLLKS